MQQCQVTKVDAPKYVVLEFRADFNSIHRDPRILAWHTHRDLCGLITLRHHDMRRSENPAVSNQGAREHAFSNEYGHGARKGRITPLRIDPTLRKIRFGTIGRAAQESGRRG